MGPSKPKRPAPARTAARRGVARKGAASGEPLPVDNAGATPSPAAERVAEVLPKHLPAAGKSRVAKETGVHGKRVHAEPVTPGVGEGAAIPAKRASAGRAPTGEGAARTPEAKAPAVPHAVRKRGPATSAAGTAGPPPGPASAVNPSAPASPAPSARPAGACSSARSGRARSAASSAEPSAPRRRARPVDRGARRRAILDAALAVFDAHGFAKARLDDVARHAGVAKGTLYLYFADKNALFEGLVQETLTPILVDADALVPDFPGTTRDLIDALLELLATRIIEGPGSAIPRLMIREGAHFPDLAAFYYREVVSRGSALIRQVVRRGLERGEITSDALERFPQLAVAPALLAVVWNGLFHAIAPLDVRALLGVHRDLLLKGLGCQDL